MKIQKILKNKGQSTVEFAFVCLVFFALLFGLFDMFKICYSWASLQYAVNAATRQNSFGLRSDTNDTFQAVTNGMGISPADINIYALDGTLISGALTGNASTFVRLVGHKTVTLNAVSDTMLSLMGNRATSYEVYAETMIRNEPFG